MAIRKAGGGLRKQGMDIGTAPANGGMVAQMSADPPRTKRRQQRDQIRDLRDERGDTVGVARSVTVV